MAKAKQGELDCIFKPRSVAVVGASNDRTKLGWYVMHNLLHQGFKGPVYPVNPKRKDVHSIKCYPSVSSIPDPVDMVIIVIPAKYVKGVIQECVDKKVKGAVIITAGFKEIGGKGVKLEQEINEIANEGGMRFVGPNCMGIINTDPDFTLDATFAPIGASEGKIAFMSQSGAMCVAILNHAKSEMIGFSKFVSMGNKANISGNDLLRDFGADKNTQIILMYIENFGNPRNTTIICREISKDKPIICVKSGRTKAGSEAASSHTGSIAGLDAAAEAMFRQCGIMRATSIEELFDYAIAFENQPLPKGKRIAILTNAGGPGIMAADAIEGLNLEMARFSKDTEKYLRSVLPEEAAVHNPVDMIAGATFEDYRKCLKAIIDDRNVDGVLVLNVPLVLTAEIETAETIADVARFSKKPVLCCFLGKKEDSPGVRHLTENNVPTYRFPESAVKAFRVMFDYRTWLDKDKGKVRTFKVDKAKVRKIIQRARASGSLWLEQGDVRQVLEAYGFTITRTFLARTEDEAVRLAKKQNFPVVLKIDSPDILHKWDTGGVVLDLHATNEVRRAYKQIMKSVKKKAPKAKINGVRVEKMVQGGKEVIMGMTLDPTYGPLIMFGMGGIYVEAMKDVSFRLVPLSDTDAMEMISEIKGYPLLKGIRGEKPSDLRKATEMLERLAQLVTDFHEIEELDMNPVMLMSRGAVVVDGRIKLTEE